MYHDGICYSKTYVKRDLYATTISKIKNELTRQKVLNYKARIEKLDWFWKKVIENSSKEDILKCIDAMPYEDMVSCLEIIKRKQCVSHLKKDVLDTINKKVISSNIWDSDSANSITNIRPILSTSFVYLIPPLYPGTAYLSVHRYLHWRNHLSTVLLLRTHNLSRGVMIGKPIGNRVRYPDINSAAWLSCAAFATTFLRLSLLLSTKARKKSSLLPFTTMSAPDAAASLPPSLRQ